MRRLTLSLTTQDARRFHHHARQTQRAAGKGVFSPAPIVCRGARWAPATCKFTNTSMDSMLVYVRHKSGPRFDTSFPCLTDTEFLLRLFAQNPAAFHVGTPLHSYVKQPGSISNKSGATQQIAETRRRLLRLLADGAYPMADPQSVAGMSDFHEISLRAEQTYGPLLAANPRLPFEDHLEPMLASGWSCVRKSGYWFAQ